MALILLVLLVVIALYWVLRRPRPQVPPVPPSPYARDDAFGRPDPMWGAAGVPAPQEGIGSSIASGVATGVAIGAGAAIAQEFGRRAFEHGHEGQAHASDAGVAPHHDQSQSSLAHDAGIDAFDPSADRQGIADFGDGGWDDGGGVDDRGGWDT
jgi:hypothetical protein